MAANTMVVILPGLQVEKHCRELIFIIYPYWVDQSCEKNETPAAPRVGSRVPFYVVSAQEGQKLLEVIFCPEQKQILYQGLFLPFCKPTVTK